jgi:hypothetical protein
MSNILSLEATGSNFELYNDPVSIKRSLSDRRKDPDVWNPVYFGLAGHNEFKWRVLGSLSHDTLYEMRLIQRWMVV